MRCGVSESAVVEVRVVESVSRLCRSTRCVVSESTVQMYALWSQ